ncbi:hypothetical protein [Actinoplanes sp. NPDC051411]|uniref:hypothetical protein n=1 Tax=Actinoplanes sp. NPDC051411 TaxID=3155522 RepID=UPI00343E0DD0
MSIAELLALWFNTPTWAESQNFLLAHPELCTSDGEQVLREQLAVQRDPALIGVLDDHLALLGRCRAKGVPAAYGWWTALIAEARRYEAEAAGSERRYESDNDLNALDTAVLARQRLAGLSFGSQRRAEAGHAIARILLERYRVGSRPDDLTSAVAAAEAALALPVTRPFRWADLVVQLGRALCLEAGDGIDRGIALTTGLLGRVAPDSTAVPALLTGLAQLLHARHGQTGDPTDLDRALTALDQAGAISRRLRDQLPAILELTAAARLARFQEIHEEQDLETAIATYEEALAGAGPGRPQILANLAGALLLRVELRPDDADLARAIALLTEAAGPGRPAVQSRLASAWFSRYELSNDASMLDRAVDHGEVAVRRSPTDAADHPSHLVTLAHALRARSAHTSNLQEAGRAVDLYREALTLTPQASPRRRDRETSLGGALVSRYQLGGAETDLDEAQLMLDMAIGHGPAAVAALSNLAGGYWTRYERGGDLQALDHAAALFHRAAQLSPEGSTARLRCLSNEAAALGARARHTGSDADVDAALHRLREAWTIAPPAGPDRATVASNLGNALRTRAERTGDAGLLDEAVGVLEAALSSGAEPLAQATLHSNLGTALAARHDAATAVEHLRQALSLTPPGSPAMTDRLLQLGLALGEAGMPEGRRMLREAYREGAERDTAAALHAAYALGRWAERDDDRDLAAEAYGAGVGLARRLYETQVLRSHKESWLRDTADLPVRAAKAYLRTASPDPEAAVTALERGRALLLLSALTGRRLEPRSPSEADRTGG